MLVLYIHGFLSSPQSLKAQQTEKYCVQQQLEFACPFLPPYPDQAVSILEDVVRANQQQKVGLLGSSMGGFYATYLSQCFQLPAVLVNPAIRPYNLMNNYLDRNLTNYHTEDVYRLTQDHTDQLRQLQLNRLQYPALLWLLAQTGDETLDYRLAEKYYAPCRQTIEKGGDHSFQNFDHHLPQIIEFLQATSN